MDKKSLKIAGWALGLSMVVAGVGAAVSASQNSPIETKADDAYYSLTPDQASTGSTATSYITDLTEFTYNGVSWKMAQWNPNTLQVKTNKPTNSEFRFYNTSAFAGKIKQVVITFATLNVTAADGFMFVGGTSEVTATSGGTSATWDDSSYTLTWTPDSADNFTYFAFYQNGKVASGSNYLADSDAIVVTYEDGASSSPAEEVVNTIKTLAGGWDNDADTENCATNYQTVKAMILELSNTELENFMNPEEGSDGAHAKETYEHWCEVNGDATPYSGPIVSAAKTAGNAATVNGSTIVVTVAVLAVGLACATALFFSRKKKQN